MCHIFIITDDRLQSEIISYILVTVDTKRFQIWQHCTDARPIDVVKYDYYPLLPRGYWNKPVF